MFTNGLSVSGQKKSQKNEPAPTKSELESMMKEMEKEMGEMDPETAEMMKQMGIEMPDMKKMQNNLSNMSESDIAEAWEDDGRVIPERDASRILKAGSVKLTEATLPAYIKKIHGSVAIRAGSAASSAADQLLAAARAEGIGGSQIANGLWIFGASNSAILVLGKTLEERPSGTDDLNNYAAFLVMAGAEEAALPILMYLNSRYRRNSTVLNNIAQAWFGLGDLEKASLWLDSTLAVYPGHSQANLTKRFIQENKGDKKGAAESARRSLKTGYSHEKDSRLRDLGGTVKGADITWYPPLPQDPLGFGQHNWPAYPMSIAESESLKPEWEAYREAVRAKLAAVTERYEAAENEFTEGYEKRMMQMLTPKLNLRMPATFMPFSSKVKAGLEYYSEEDDKHQLDSYEEQLRSLDGVQQKIAAIEAVYEADLQKLLDGPGRKIGEGSTRADMEAYCNEKDRITGRYLASVNKVLEESNAKWIGYWRKEMSRRLNYLQYSLGPEEFELEKLRAQEMWLGMISDQEVRFGDKCNVGPAQPQQKPKVRKLADFYDMNCKQKSVMNLGIGSVTIECNKMTTSLNAKFVKFTVKENMDNGAIIRGTAEIGYGVSAGKAAGPFKAEAKAEGAAFVEFDDSGITDAGIKATLSTETGTGIVPDGVDIITGVSDPSVTVIGAEARWGWNSGGSLQGKGLLNKLQF